MHITINPDQFAFILHTRIKQVRGLPVQGGTEWYVTKRYYNVDQNILMYELTACSGMLSGSVMISLPKHAVDSNFVLVN